MLADLWQGGASVYHEAESGLASEKVLPESVSGGFVKIAGGRRERLVIHFNSLAPQFRFEYFTAFGYFVCGKL